MKGRKLKTNRKRLAAAKTSNNEASHTLTVRCKATYDGIPSVQEDSVEGILLLAQQVRHTPAIGGFGHVSVGGIRVWLDLASSEEICSLVTAIETEAEEAQKSAEDLIKYYGDSLRDNRVFIARAQDGDLVAAAIYGPSAITRSAKQVVVSGYIYVNKDYRGQGVGRDFLQQCCIFATRYGFQAILGEVSAQDGRATEFLQSGGFQVFGGLPQIALSSSVADSDKDKLLIMKVLSNNFVMKMSRL